MADINLDNLLNGVQGKFWNYSNPQKDGYSKELQGTLVKVSIAQAHEFGKPGQKMYWSDGNPVILLRMHIKDYQDETWFFDIKPKSTMWFEDIQPACPGGSLEQVIGKEIKLTFLGLEPVPGKAVNRNKFMMQVIGEGRCPSEGFDKTMPPTLAQAQGQVQAQAPAAPSPQQYTVQGMVTGQQQQAYAQQQMQPQMDPRLQQAMRSAQAAGAASQAQVIAQQFPGAVIQNDFYDSDVPF